MIYTNVLMQIIILLSFILFVGCDLNESLIHSIGDKAKEVIDQAKSQGGSKGIDTLNKELKKLKDKLADREDDLEDLEDDLEDKEEDIDKKAKELNKIKNRLAEVEAELENPDLTAEQRRALEEQRDDLIEDKTALESKIRALEEQRDDLEEQRDDLEEQRDDLIEDKTALELAKRQAESERDCWKRTLDLKVRICDRNTKVKKALVSAVNNINSAINDCADVHICHLEGITSLDLSGTWIEGDQNHPCSDHSLGTLKPSDFEGLTYLERLTFQQSCLINSGLMAYTASEGFFSGLDRIKRINFQTTGIFKLSANFFNGVLDTLEDGQVYVNGFIYCSSPLATFKSKLGVNEGEYGDFTGTASHSGINTATYCY